MKDLLILFALETLLDKIGLLNDIRVCEAVDCLFIHNFCNNQKHLHWDGSPEQGKINAIVKAAGANQQLHYVKTGWLIVVTQ